MSKTIKVIDLLNIVASGKNIPTTVRTFTDETGNKATDIYKFNIFGFYENDRELSLVGSWLNNTMKLNEEVEILEDEKEIDIDIETKLFDDISMCLKRLSDFSLEAKTYVERYEDDLAKYKETKKLDN